MNCPIDGTTLQMTDRQGIEIDYCPECRGVWLDRGELDKVIERSASWDAGAGGGGGREEKTAAKPAKKSKSKSFFETIMESVGGEGG
jgi:uncharacterized protein